jgi:hypothetical protein
MWLRMGVDHDDTIWHLHAFALFFRGLPLGLDYCCYTGGLVLLDG